jgi:DNA repair protein RAD16
MECSHSVMQHFCHFNRDILNPIKRSGYVSEGRRAMLKLKDQVLDAILLRRTKAIRSSDIMLPPRYVEIREDHMDERETDFYDALYTQSKAQFNTYVAAGTVLNNYAHIFDILIRLRQAVDHPYLVIYSKTNDDAEPARPSVLSSGKRLRAADRDEDAACVLCHEPPDNPRKATCGHIFCRECAIELVENFDTTPSADRTGVLHAVCSCPACDKPLTIRTAELVEEEASEERVAFKSRKSSIINRIDLSRFQSSSKMEALMQVRHAMFDAPFCCSCVLTLLLQEIYYMQKRDPGAKGLVFSQFVSMLDVK